MATTTETLEPPASASIARRTHSLRLFVGAFVAGIIAGVVLLGAALAAYGATYQGRVLPGVQVGDVDLSGLDRDRAGEALAAAYSGYRDGRVTIHTSAGDIFIPYRGFSREPDVVAMVDAAMAVGRTGSDLEGALDEVRIALQREVLAPQVALDEDALARAVAQALAPLDRAPVDASISIGPVGYELRVARPGVGFDLAAAQATVLEAAVRPDAPAEAVVDVEAIQIRPTIGDAAVMTALASAQRIVGDVAVTDSDKTWTIPASTVRGWVRFTPTADGSVETSVADAAIPASLAAAAKELKRDPVEATFLTGKSGAVVGVTASRDGRHLDTDATSDAIVLALADRAKGAAPVPVPAVVVTVSPKLTTAEAQQVAPLMVRLSSWKTWFPISERNYYGANIWLPAQYINGTVLYPGQRFEWWRAVGPISSARGFGAGGFIAGDHTEPTGALGGGMCSSSTTLFNAALRAGLQMGARSNHKYYINRYPLGLDATVSMSGGRVAQTVTFTNDMEHPIIIRGYRVKGTSGKGWVRYEIWGVPDGRKVTLSKPVVWNLRKAVTNVVSVTSLPTGVRKQTEYPVNGMDVSVTRVVRDSAGRVIHRETYNTHYQLWNGRIEVGA